MSSYYPPPREPECCKVCGVPLEWYGSNGYIIGWHFSVAAANSYLAHMCSKCCLEQHMESINKENEMTEDTLELWYTIRLPDTCQTHIDIDDSSGELVIEIKGVGSAPATEPINGRVASGVVRSFHDRCVLIDVVVTPT